MKKGLLLALMCVVFVSSSAQNAIGIKAGVNLASMTEDIEGEFGDGWSAAIHPVLTASIIGKVELSYTVNLTLELGLAQRGLKADYDKAGTEGEVSLTFNQIQFSPGVAFNVSDEFSIGIGPYVGYATKAKISAKRSEGGVEESQSVDEDFEDEQKLDYGANLNLNYLIDDAFLISTGYSLGFMDYSAGESSDSDRVRNSGIMVSI